MDMRLLISIAALAFAGLPGCASRGAHPRDPSQVIDMNAMRIVARADGRGGYEFTSYDAPDLFDEANRELDAGRCPQAVALYDRIVTEFSDSSYVSPALYNGGLCLAQSGESEGALDRFHTLLETRPDSPDVRHASFQAGHLSVELERWTEAQAHAERLLTDSTLPPDERLEAMAIRAQALTGEGELESAAEQARQGLQYYRIHGSSVMPDEYFAAALNFTLAETIRLTADRMKFPDTTQEEQRAVLVRRAELLLEAQRTYFDTIHHTNAHWAAAAGHRIGGLYDTLWHDLMESPVPQHLSDGAKGVYHEELAKLIKPLLRHAIRYWELTMMMIERTGVETPWAARTRGDLERTRALLVEQPAGLGGLPQSRIDAARAGTLAAPEETPVDSPRSPTDP